MYGLVRPSHDIVATLAKVVGMVNGVDQDPWFRMSLAMDGGWETLASTSKKFFLRRSTYQSFGRIHGLNYPGYE